MNLPMATAAAKTGDRAIHGPTFLFALQAVACLAATGRGEICLARGAVLPDSRWARDGSFEVTGVAVRYPESLETGR